MNLSNIPIGNKLWSLKLFNHRVTTVPYGLHDKLRLVFCRPTFWRQISTSGEPLYVLLIKNMSILYSNNHKYWIPNADNYFSRKLHNPIHFIGGKKAYQQYLSTNIAPVAILLLWFFHCEKFVQKNIWKIVWELGNNLLFL